MTEVTFFSTMPATLLWILFHAADPHSASVDAEIFLILPEGVSRMFQRHSTQDSNYSLQGSLDGLLTETLRVWGHPAEPPGVTVQEVRLASELPPGQQEVKAANGEMCPHF